MPQLRATLFLAAFLIAPLSVANSWANTVVPAASPTAGFAFGPAAPVAGQAVSFDGSASTCAATPCGYRWTDDADGSVLGSGQSMSFTFMGTGTKYVRLTVTDALGRTASVEHDVVVGSPATPPATSALLTWAPPACGDATHACQDLYLTNTGSHQSPSLSSGTDYRIHLPTNGPLVGGITIAAGHNVQIIGGEIDLTYPCSNDASACMGVYVAKNSPGAVYVEGVWIHNPSTIGTTCPGGASSSSQTCSTGDAIDVNTANNGSINVNTITLQNIRADGISGCSGYGDHADVFQPYQAPNDTIQVDRLTGVGNCQGLQVDPDLAWSSWGTYPASVTIKNANIDITPNPYSGIANRYAWWLTYGLSCNSGPVTLIGDYTQEPGGSLSGNSVWPDVNQPSTCTSQWVPPALSFPSSPQISGNITEGLPAGGDYVPAGVAGTGYVSPGHQ